MESKWLKDQWVDSIRVSKYWVSVNVGLTVYVYIVAAAYSPQC
jgi:hypothetical protein